MEYFYNNRSPLKRFILSLLIVQLVFPFSLSIQAADLALPSDDVVAPTVTHEPIEGSVSNKGSHVISATVVDDVAVQSVILFYRTVGTMTYKRMPMTKMSNTDLYTAMISADELAAPGLEYYIQAKDLAGNSLLRGYSFSPLKITVEDKALATSEPQANTGMVAALEEPPVLSSKSKEKKESIWKNKWLWIGLGAVVIGAAAAGGGGGGDDDNGGGTGTLTVSAPVPE